MVDHDSEIKAVILRYVRQSEGDVEEVIITCNVVAAEVAIA